jgi:hypothetical protein
LEGPQERYQERLILAPTNNIKSSEKGTLAGPFLIRQKQNRLEMGWKSFPAAKKSQSRNTANINRIAISFGRIRRRGKIVVDENASSRALSPRVRWVDTHGSNLMLKKVFLAAAAALILAGATVAMTPAPQGLREGLQGALQGPQASSSSSPVRQIAFEPSRLTNWEGPAGARRVPSFFARVRFRRTTRSRDLPRSRRGRRECPRSGRRPRCASHISPSCSRAAARGGA